ncbi:MAG TPA: molybdopterin-guanine dinucleotide biosynthesis protein B [Coriobacteriia bacterium]
MTETARIPVVSIVGKSDSGKTTLVEGIIRELVAHGYRVASVKHHIHEVEVDQPGKDSWRHGRAGAVTTMISSPSQFVLVRKVDRERTIEELVEAAGDVDIVITEGFKRAGDVRIEVARRARSDELISGPGEAFAVVTDMPEIVPEGVPVFPLDAHSSVAEMIERSFLMDGEE